MPNTADWLSAPLVPSIYSGIPPVVSTHTFPDAARYPLAETAAPRLFTPSLKAAHNSSSRSHWTAIGQNASHKSHPRHQQGFYFMLSNLNLRHRHVKSSVLRSPFCQLYTAQSHVIMSLLSFLSAHTEVRKWVNSQQIVFKQHQILLFNVRLPNSTADGLAGYGTCRQAWVWSPGPTPWVVADLHMCTCSHEHIKWTIKKTERQTRRKSTAQSDNGKRSFSNLLNIKQCTFGSHIHTGPTQVCEGTRSMETKQRGFCPSFQKEQHFVISLLWVILWVSI